jgi:hypothetical protein
MKITEATTLAELHLYLIELGSPLVTMMKTHPGSRYTRHAIVNASGVGTFAGEGDTEAEAINNALHGLWLLVSNAPDPTLNKFRQTADEVCHGCMHARDDHPNDSGCQFWHAGPP